MEMIHEINWNNFKTKFNGKEQKAFEALCYLLFCSEFNEDKGIFRYKNQTGSETDPIERDGSVIAWQAKFLETKISTKKDEFMAAIEATKRKNPSVNEILFYLNQEFSESSKKNKKDPAYKTEIEEYAQSQGVGVGWRVPSHFERQLALEKNKTLAQHFFSLGKSIVDFITELGQHTDSILAPIHSKIVFNGKEIKIDRSATLKELRSALESSSMVILSGQGGTGKTAVIKDLYDQLNGVAPFFVLKASEFNISNVNDLFAHYGSFGFTDFIEEHKSLEEKYIVVDSAEKLSDIESQAVFHEFLSRLLQNRWKIIFTTRHSFVDDLKWQLLELYNRTFEVINIENIVKDYLFLLRRTYSFNVPENERLLELLLNPFYLNEYLQNYTDAEASQTYSDFRKLIWNKKIQNSFYRKNNIHLEREKCFLEIAKARANSGSFYVAGDNLNNEALTALASDEVIKYDSDNGGYFITHDTYEEWALDKIIEREFNRAGDCKGFLDSLGTSLPIRRAFRIWLSEQVLTNPGEVKSLIEESIVSNDIGTFWKDEVLVSVLLSDYSEGFFAAFEKKLLEDDERLLMRVVFLLRIACKEIDESLLRMLGLLRAEGAALKTVFTVPKGKGWQHTIDFIHRHKEEFGLRNMNIILPLLHDWNSKNKQGETTRKASQIGLYYYEQMGGPGYRSRDEIGSKLIQVILQGAHEIKDELVAIFGQILASGKPNHRDKYHSLIRSILTSMIDGGEVLKALPEYVIKLADRYWFRIPKREYGHMRVDVQEEYCITDDYDFKYFPASALQTPVYQLLRCSYKETLDFILSFTNKTVECFAKSDLRNEVEEIEVILDEGATVRQYISNRLWNTYRGTQVSTTLLESIHMALEKWLLEQAKIASPEVLESVCKYLLRNSKSASITAVVVSIILAQPEKLFNIAQILFRTKKLFFYDSARMLLDQSHKVQLVALKTSFPNLGDFQKEIFDEERIKACDGEHRKLSLEHLAFQYQFVKVKDDENFEKHRQILWAIWDEYYKDLPPEAEQTEGDKTWRLFLARMDTRKMKVKAEPEKDGDKILFTFDLEIEPKLRKHSEDSLQRISEAMKYNPLRMWSEYRFKREGEKYKQYEQYESNPRLVITETREILDALRKKAGEGLLLLNRSTPAYTCAVLVRDFSDALTAEEKEFCSEVIIAFASLPLSPGKYSYQVSDGTEPAIISLPQLMKCDSKAKGELKTLLFQLLLNSRPHISSFAIRAVLHDLWEVDFESAQSLFLGYLALKPKHEELVEEIRKENYKKQVYEVSTEDLLKKFKKRNARMLKKITSNSITYEDVGNLSELSLGTLNTAFELVPLGTENEIHKTFVRSIIPVFGKELFMDDRREERVDYALKQRFLNKFAYFTLTSKKEDIAVYVKPFVENFSDSEDMAKFFHEFISVEDSLNRYEEFWTVWDLFYEPVVEMCKAGHSRYHATAIVHNYLLAWGWWKESAREWHSLREREKAFLRKVAQEIGHCPSVLYSISKILNDIGSKFLEDGLFWISGILERNPNLISDKLDTNTVYYIENVVRKYVVTDRQRIKRTKKIKDAVLIILNFLVEGGSITGYLLREDIL